MPIIKSPDQKSIGILINSSSPQVANCSQEEFVFNSNLNSLNGFPLSETNFVEFGVEISNTGLFVEFYRYLDVGNLSQITPITFNPKTLDKVVISQSMGGLALSNNAFKGKLIFKASQILTGNQFISIIFVW